MPAASRRTFFINDVPGLATAALSTVDHVDRADRGRAGDVSEHDAAAVVGGTAGRGATALSTSWSLAEGATGFFHTLSAVGESQRG